MIKNSLKYTRNFYNLSKNIKIGLEFFEKNDLKQFSNGKYEILGDEVYINIQEYDSKPLSEGKWEAHRKYIDIQFIISGTEKIGVGEIQNFITIEEYSETNDVEFLTTKFSTDFVEMKENDFIILYPFDVHMPQINIDKPTYVKKAVLKIAV